MDDVTDEAARDAALLSELVDPGARQILEAEDPWQAYEVANALFPPLVHQTMTLCGGMFIAWAELVDVFETGKTPVADAHAALRRAAAEWLRRTGPPTEEHVRRWVSLAGDEVAFLFDRDGTFWQGPRA
ncbi:hypothetical protein [Sanguibacter suaedae]|uniref:Uncharacterized protein n=1 Tax=Sanguibacter suaedae TaxID=2795737 RepID=A0A934M9J0_9MICO|nr:hypothetical protein [Sanguibacter suaedae]MBI9114640.1 hypothetical protein [Sanguibacter suaedae]